MSHGTSRRTLRDVRARMLAISIAMLIGTNFDTNAYSQSPPGVPVFEAVGFGIVRPWNRMGMLQGAAHRDPDAGGGAEFVTIPIYPTLAQVERWKVSADGVPYFAGFVPTHYHASSALWADVDGDGVADLLCGEPGPDRGYVEVFHMGPAGLVTPGQLFGFDPSLPYMGPEGYLMVADVNADGHPDIGVVAAEATLTHDGDHGPLAWLLNNGSGSFTEGTRGSSCSQPVVTQFGPDLFPDLWDWDPESLWMAPRVGVGNGTFGFLGDTFLESSGRPIVADLDHDGANDIVAGRFLYRGVAGGLPVEFDSLAANVTAMADVDHDGIPDLVAVESGKVRVARGLSGFSFTPFIDYPAGTLGDHLSLMGPFGLSAVMDANADGWTDVMGVSTSNPGRLVYAIPGLPGGRFHQLDRVPTGHDPEQVALADLLGADGRLDLVVLDRGARQLELRAGAGDGTFGPAQFESLPAGGARFVLRDLNGDSRLDVAVACDSANMIRIFPGTASGLGTPIDLSSDAPLTDLAIGDIDEDGHLDILAATASGDVRAWRGDGTFGFSQVDWGGTYLRSDGRLRLGDINRDGHLDLIFQEAGRSVAPIHVFMGDGQGSFGYAPDRIPIEADLVWPHAPFESADLAGDGREYVAFAAPDSFSFLYAYFRAFTSDSGRYSSMPYHCEDPPCINPGGDGYEVAPTARQVAVADVTGDGIPDVIVLSSDSAVLTVIPGLGGGQFGIPIAHIVDSSPTSFALGDVDGDGQPDVMVADAGSDEVMLMRHLGAATAGVAPKAVNHTLQLHVDSAPNASHIQVRLSLPAAGVAQLDFFDLQGRRLFRQRLGGAAPGEQLVNVEGGRLPRSGVYFARLSQGSGHAIARFTRFY